MDTQDNTKVNDRVNAYNDQYQDQYLRSLTMGSLRRPRSTLADLAGLAANDNNEAKGE